MSTSPYQSHLRRTMAPSALSYHYGVRWIDRHAGFATPFTGSNQIRVTAPSGLGERRSGRASCDPGHRALWLEERPNWPAATTSPASLLTRRSGCKKPRTTVRGASNVITTIAANAGLDDEAITAHVSRHTFATTLARGGTDLVIVADLLGHAHLDTVRAYTRPTEDDRTKALNLLPTDR